MVCIDSQNAPIPFGLVNGILVDESSLSITAKDRGQDMSKCLSLKMRLTWDLDNSILSDRKHLNVVASRRLRVRGRDPRSVTSSLSRSPVALCSAIILGCILRYVGQILGR